MFTSTPLLKNADWHLFRQHVLGAEAGFELPFLKYGRPVSQIAPQQEKEKDTAMG